VASDAAAPTAAAPSDLFGAPAFAAGRAFSAATIDALLCEAHFAPHLVFIIKQMVRASRKQALQLIPVSDAIAMAMLACPVPAPPAGVEEGFSPAGAHAYTASGAAFDTAAGAAATGGGPGRERSGSGPSRRHDAIPSSTGTYRRIATYGQLFEALLRGWHMLPVGLYRRREPGVYPSPPVVVDPALQYIAAFGGVFIPGISVPGGGAVGGAGSGTSGPFRYDKSLLSYVFTNPPPNTLLNRHDFVYVLRATHVRSDLSAAAKAAAAAGAGGE
jgi:hypothetical protein